MKSKYLDDSTFLKYIIYIKKKFCIYIYIYYIIIELIFFFFLRKKKKKS